MRVCLLGCGAIGRTIAENADGYELYAVFDRNAEKAREFGREFSAKVAESFEQFLDFCSECDVAVEAASQKAVRDCLKILERTNVVVMSVGAFRNLELFDKFVKVAKKTGNRVFIPSGAVAGIDALKTVKGCVREVTLTTIKSPESLGVKCSERRILFEGSARDAVRLYPANVNVAATISLACMGFEKTKVRIIADPEVRENIHEIEAKGEFGELSIVVKNKKHPKNPRTSYLAALSVVRLLKSFAEEVKVGT